MDTVKSLIPEAGLIPTRGIRPSCNTRPPSDLRPSYSTCIADAVHGRQRRGIVHSAFTTAANILFPDNFMLSLNACTSVRMPNGIQLVVPAGVFPFSHLRPAMPVLLGAGQLIIDAIDSAFDLSYCLLWDPHIELPLALDMGIVQKNGAWLAQFIAPLHRHWHAVGKCPVQTDCQVQAMARYLCGRGIGLTPSGDDMLAGWMALQLFLHGPDSRVIEACRQILAIAGEQTHILSQCWLGYAAQGAVAMPVRDLLTSMAREDDRALEVAARAVLAMGATSGHDLIQGILLGLRVRPC